MFCKYQGAISLETGDSDNVFYLTSRTLGCSDFGRNIDGGAFLIGGGGGCLCQIWLFCCSSGCNSVQENRVRMPRGPGGMFVNSERPQGL